MRLNRAMIFVSDLPGMTAFYADTLGLKLIAETRLDNYVEFDTGGAVFALHEIPVSARCETTTASPRENHPIKLSFGVENDAAEAKRLEALGVTILRRPWGSYDGVDPEGNVFGIYSE